LEKEVMAVKVVNNMKRIALFKVTLVTALILSVLVSCGRKSENVANPAVDAFADVREKLKSFENGELTLDEVTSTGPGEADAKWVHSLTRLCLRPTRCNRS
jgi:hypothetical protein